MTPQRLQEVEAKWEDEADKSPAQGPGRVKELPVEGDARHCNGKAGLQMADKNHGWTHAHKGLEASTASTVESCGSTRCPKAWPTEQR